MEMVLAIFPSLNQVSLIRRNLHREGVYVEMTRSPQCLASTGCSFALRCEAGHLSAVVRASEDAGIAIPGVFSETIVNGTRTYLPIGGRERGL